MLHNDEVELALTVGERVTIAGHDLAITFREVAADSRCPVDVTCVWQGDAAVVLILESAGQRDTVTLHTADPDGQVRRAGVLLTLAGVMPAPRSDRPIPAGAYRIRLRAGTG